MNMKQINLVKHNFITQEVRPNTILDVKVDVSFRKIPKHAICFQVWRIEEDRLEAELRAQYGNFVDNCAYIIYAAGTCGTYVNQETITRDAKNGTKLERFIHFWLGEHVSEQKRSNVTHKIQELDSYFGNVATVYRETQDNESARFLSYFRKGLTIRCGALQFAKATNRLLQLRGRKFLRCVEMPDISWTHFSSDYIMILITEAQTFIWFGRSSSAIERRDALELTTKFEMISPEIACIDDGYEQSMPQKLKAVWNALLPPAKRLVVQTSPTPEREYCSKFRIYKCSYKNTRLHLDQLDVVLPTREDLSDSKATFLLDGHMQGIWLWVGKEAAPQDNMAAMGNGRAFVKKKKYAYTTPVIRVVEGHEPVEFIRLFPNWHYECTETFISFKPVSTVFGRFDSVTLCQRPKMAADTQLIDDGSGERTLYRVTKDQVHELPPANAVMLITDCCYVVQYSVVHATANSADAQNVGVNTIIYQWNGSDAAAETIIKCERYAKSCFDKQPNKIMFVQMCEYDETPHFLQIFGGKLIILQSERGIHQHNKCNNNSNSNGNVAVDLGAAQSPPLAPNEHLVLKVYGDTSYTAKAVQVYPLSSMSSKECYVLKTNHVWVWCGQSSTGDAREVAKNIGALLGESSLVLEGKEPKEFWRSVTSQLNTSLITTTGSISSNASSSSYSNSNGSSSPQSLGFLTPGVKPRPQAQLFLLWAQRGKFYSQEIIAFQQCDLSPECVYVLDANLISYIWLGMYACSYERENCLKLAQYYLETVPIARRPTTAVAVVRQGDEPNAFKGCFESWNHSLWNNYVNYNEKRKAFALKDAPNANGNANGCCVKGENGGMPTITPLTPVIRNHEKDFDRHQKYPLNTLQQETEMLPDGVNPLKREVHLTHDDFVALFNMSFWEFDELPLWKKHELKKKCKLF